MPVNGRLYGFDHHTGKRLWSTPVADQALILDQPSELPVMMFIGRIGPLALVMLLLPREHGPDIKYPEGDLQIG